jgi:hypothetical protein
MKLNFSTFTVSKTVYDRFFELEGKYRDDYFTGKRRLFNEFVIKNGCDSLLKLKGRVKDHIVKDKIHLKLWFYDFINKKLEETRAKLIKGNVISSPKTNEKKITFNDLLISAGLDKVQDFVKKS